MDTYIKNEVEFINYLSTIYKGKYSGGPLSKKVISDTRGRIKRIQHVLSIKIENHVSTIESFHELCEIIKNNDINLREKPNKNKYGYGRYLYAARLYFKFDAWKNKRNLPRPKDKRITYSASK